MSVERFQNIGILPKPPIPDQLVEIDNTKSYTAAFQNYTNTHRIFNEIGAFKP